MKSRPFWGRVDGEAWVWVDLDIAPLRPIESAPRDETPFIGIDGLGTGWIVLGDERGFYEKDAGRERKELVSWIPMQSGEAPGEGEATD